MRVAGEAIDEREARGGRISDETLLVLLNSYHEELTFTLPEAGGRRSCQWELLMDTRDVSSAASVGQELRRRAARTRSRRGRWRCSDGRAVTA